MAQWLSWAAREFSLEGVKFDNFSMTGKELLRLGREAFLARSPPFVGDILWEHLEILQKGASAAAACVVLSTCCCCACTCTCMLKLLSYIFVTNVIFKQTFKYNNDVACTFACAYECHK